MRFVLSFFRALFFLLRLHTGLFAGVEPRARRIIFKNGQVELDVYEPRRLRGVLLLVHGLVPAGHKDAAIRDLAGALRASGFRVLVPHLAPLAELRIDAADRELLEEIVITVSLDRSLCPAGRIALVSGSYPGLLALQAAGNPELAGRVAALLLVGVFADPARVAERALEGTDEARWTIYRNFLHLYSESSRALEKAFGTALADRLLERTLPELSFLLDQAKPATRKLFYRIENEPAFRRELGRNLIGKAARVRESFELDAYYAGIEAPVVLLHDARDPLADPEESRQVFRGLTEAGGSAVLLVTQETPLASLRLRPGAPAEIFALSRLLGRFFRYVSDFSAARAR